MGKALEVVTAVATPATSSAAAALAGNSLTIRDAPSSKGIWMVALWSTHQVSGDMRLTSPLLHDSSVGIHMIGQVGPALAARLWSQRLHPQDNLSIALTGGAAGDLAFASLLVYYEDLPGVNSRLITYDELMRRGTDLYAFQNTMVNVGTTGQYQGSQSITATGGGAPGSGEDQLKANRDYAILGCNQRGAISHLNGYSGVDFGNLRVAVPGISLDNSFANTSESTHWFMNLARITGLPLIPVFNASNKNLTLIDNVVDENAADPIITTLTCLLS